MEPKSDEEFLERLKIGNRAVKKAQKLNWEKGLPNVYSKNKKIFYEYPDETNKNSEDDKKS
jgi:hypothetical protein